jgi:fibronectin type 3 domain-containing protein
MSRGYEEWVTERIVIDSSLKNIERCVQELKASMGK